MTMETSHFLHGYNMLQCNFLFSKHVLCLAVKASVPFKYLSFFFSIWEISDHVCPENTSTHPDGHATYAALDRSGNTLQASSELQSSFNNVVD